MSRVTDEAVQAAIEEFNIDRGGPGIELLYGKRDRDDMRRALLVGITHLARASVMKDPRVVELAEALRECVSDMELTEEYYGQHDGAQDALTRARAALANLEKKG